MLLDSSFQKFQGVSFKGIADRLNDLECVFNLKVIKGGWLKFSVE